MKKIDKNLLSVDRISAGSIRLLIGFCLLIISSYQGFAQSEPTIVELKPTITNGQDHLQIRIVEEKAIEFSIIGMSNDNDVWTMEELLAGQIGIDRARMGGDMSFCLVITLQGSNIGEDFIKTIVESKGFTVENYTERWINKPAPHKGQQVFIQDSPPRTDKVSTTTDETIEVPEKSKKEKKRKNKKQEKE